MIGKTTKISLAIFFLNSVNYFTLLETNQIIVVAVVHLESKGHVFLW